MVHNTHYDEIHDNKLRHAKEAFTLVEIMIALFIIGIVVGGAFVVIPGYLERAYLSATKTTLKNVQTSILMFKQDTGKYPESLADLYKSPGIEGWRGPYGGLKGWPEDGWGKRLVYHLTPDGQNPYELYSYGSTAGRQTPKEKRVSAW